MEFTLETFYKSWGGSHWKNSRFIERKI